jgi:hypothetical protein
MLQCNLKKGRLTYTYLPSRDSCSLPASPLFFPESSLPKEPQPQREEIQPSAKQWQNFRRTLNRLNVWCWQANYSDSAVCDGTGWSAEIVYSDRSVVSSGDNCLPGSGGRALPITADETDKYLREILSCGRPPSRTRIPLVVEPGALPPDPVFSMSAAFSTSCRRFDSAPSHKSFVSSHLYSVSCSNRAISERKVRTRSKLSVFEAVTATQPCEAGSSREVLEHPTGGTNECGGHQRVTFFGAGSGPSVDRYRRPVAQNLIWPLPSSFVL